MFELSDPSEVRLAFAGDGARIVFPSGLVVRVRRHPSESGPYLAARVLLFVMKRLEGYEPSFSAGLCRGREPVFSCQAEDGCVLWAGVGRVPDPARLRRAASLAAEVVFLCYGWKEACGRALARARLPRTRVWWVDAGFLEALLSASGETLMSFRGQRLRAAGAKTRLLRLYPR